MKPGIPLFFAERHFRHSRKLVSAVVTVALSLVPLILVLVITNGMIDGITRRYMEVGTYHLQAQSYDAPVPLKDAEDIAQRVGTIEGVRIAVPEYGGTALAYAAEGRTGIRIRAVPDYVFEKDVKLRQYLEFSAGSFDLQSENSILLSTGVAQSLSAKVGDRIKLLTALTMPGRTAAVIKPTVLTVTGIFSSGYQEMDALTVYINAEKGAALFRDPSGFTLGIKVRDEYMDSLDRMRWRVMSVLPQGFYTYTWYDLEKSLYKSLLTTKNLLVFIMILIVCVASVNISSTLIMLVMENSQAIAILKSTGGSPRLVTQSFMVTGFLIGCAGTAIGLLFGLFLAVNINSLISAIEGIINFFIDAAALLKSSGSAASHVRILNPEFYLEKIPVILRFRELAAVSFLSILVATLASYFPARRAAKIKPLDILQKY